MPPATALIAAMLWLPFHHHHDAAASTVHAARVGAVSRWRVGQWFLTVRRERFSGAVGCEIVRRRASVQRQALVLTLPPRVDTSQALYRIDAGRPMSVADDRSILAIQGFALWKDDTENPSGAVVRIPLAKLAGATTVQIETRYNGHVWRIPIDGLAAAQAAAKKEGCN